MIPAGEPILSCEGLGRAFGPVEAVRDVSFVMHPRESLALIGPNGAGKTTTLGMLTTAIRPDRGRATVLGADVVSAPRRVREGLGVLFQEPALDDRMTPRETLAFHCAMHGLPRRETRARVDAALGWAELGGVADRPVRGFSGGMKRRLELARALMHGPRLLVLDEPTLGLDPQGRRDLWERIDALRADGLAVLMTTHVLAEAERCDRVGIVDAGRLVAIETPDALKRRFAGGPSASLEDVFLALTGRALRDGATAARPQSLRRSA